MFIFFQTFKYLVMIKFRDQWIELGKDTPAWYYAPVASPYRYIETAAVWGQWLWLVLGILLLSKGQHSAYTFPVRPASDISIQERSLKVRKRLKEETFDGSDETLLQYLQNTCLPKTTAMKCGPGGNHDGVYLSAAGGVPAAEAEVRQ